MVGYVPLPSFRGGGGLDFGGLNDGLDFLIKQNEKNKLLQQSRDIGAAMYGPGGGPVQSNALLGGRPSPAAQAQASNLSSQYGAPTGAMSPAMAAAAAAGRDYTPDTPEIALIKQFEGYTPNAQPDFKQTSIGYGTRAEPGQTSIDRGTAEERLRQEVAPVRAMVDQSVPGANLQQRASLISTGYNLGTGRGGLADFIPQAQAGDWSGAANRLLGYNHAGGEVNKGLTTRRAQEAAMLTGGGSPAATPQQQAAPSRAVTAAPGPNYDAAIAVAAQQGNIPLAMQLTAAKRQADETAYDRQRQTTQDAQSSQLHQLQIDAGQRAAIKAADEQTAVIAQNIQDQPPEAQLPMLRKLYAVHPEFENTLKAHGIDPNNPAQTTAFLVAKARGLLEPKGESFGKIGTGVMGEELMGWINPAKRSVTPVAAGNAAPGAEVGLKGPDYISALREANPMRADKAENIVAGREAMPSSASRDKTALAIQHDVRQADSQFNSNRFHYRQQWENPNSNVGKSVIAFNTAIAHMGKLETLLPSLPASASAGPLSAPLNKARIWYREASNDADINRWKDAALLLSGEMVKAATGAEGTESDRHAYLDRLDPSKGQETARANLKEFVGLLEEKAHKLASDRDRVMGRYAEDMPVVYPGSQEVLDKLQGNAPAAPQVSLGIKPAGVPDAQIRAEAQKAIAAGKDPAAVQAQLKAWGIQ